MISILGSGFGLYGHLPALVELGYDVSIPARYRAQFEGRPELAGHASGVRFVEDEDSLLRDAAAAVLARRPADNAALAYRAIQERGPRRLVIEKPPAPTPAAARALMSALTEADIHHVVPYLLLHCDWAGEMRRSFLTGAAREAHLEWLFHSPTVTSGSWKASHDAGGGTLNYYFIHVLALAVYLLGEDLVVEDCWRLEAGIGMRATHGPNSFTASFRTDPSGSSCQAGLDGATVLCAETPFGATPRRGVRDPRIETLKRFYVETVFGPESVLDAQQNARVIDLWETFDGRAST